MARGSEGHRKGWVCVTTVSSKWVLADHLVLSNKPKKVHSNRMRQSLASDFSHDC